MDFVKEYKIVVLITSDSKDKILLFCDVKNYRRG